LSPGWPTSGRQRPARCGDQLARNADLVGGFPARDDPDDVGDDRRDQPEDRWPAPPRREKRRETQGDETQAIDHEEHAGDAFVARNQRQVNDPAHQQQDGGELCDRGRRAIGVDESESPPDVVVGEEA
jgi:hypothetical protein